MQNQGMQNQEMEKMMNTEQFGERLSKIRKEKNMTQEEFSARIGVTPQAVSKWERAQSLPDVTILCGICDVMEVEADYLLGITVRKPKITESNDEKERQLLLGNLCAEPLELIFGRAIIDIIVEGLKTDMIAQKRIQTAREFGMLIPVIRIRDDINLEDNEFCFYSYGKLLYRSQMSSLEETSYKIIIDEFFRVCTEQYAFILNRQIVKTLVDNVRMNYPAVINNVIPEKITYSFLQKVLIELVNRKSSIRNLVKIIEVTEDIFDQNKAVNIRNIVDVILDIKTDSSR